MTQRITFGDLGARHIGKYAVIDDGRQTLAGTIETIAHYEDPAVTGVSLKGRLAVQRKHDWAISVYDSGYPESGPVAHWDTEAPTPA